MPIQIQGNWEVSVSFWNPFALPQRFQITGASAGNGIYIGNGDTVPVNVVGGNWVVNMQASDDYDARDTRGDNFRWFNSTIERTATRIENGYYVFDLRAQDFVNDGSYDLGLTFRQLIPVVPPPPPPSPTPPPVITEPPVVVIPPPPPPSPTPPPIVTEPPVVVIPPPIQPAPKLGVGKVYTLINDEDRIERERLITTHGIWLDQSGNATGNMLAFFTSSLETSGSFRTTVYQKQFDQCASDIHFTIAYGHKDGSGSRDLGGNDFYTPTKAVYGQYRNLCLPATERTFKIGTKEIKHFYAINVAQKRMGDQLDAGNLEINLHHLSGSQFLTGNGNRNAHTGSNVRLGAAGNILRLIDDYTLDYVTDLNRDADFYTVLGNERSKFYSESGPYQYIVSGTLETGVYNKSNPQVYGLSYPRLGIVILDADLLDASASFLTVTGSDVAGDNNAKLLLAMSASALYTDASGDYLGFQSRKIKHTFREQIFVRVKSQEYNFSNNPTFVTGSEGQIIDDFYNNPTTYFTEIGLYNQNKELLAIAKPSNPIYKNFNEEALVGITITYG